LAFLIFGTWQPWLTFALPSRRIISLFAAWFKKEMKRIRWRMVVKGFEKEGKNEKVIHIVFKIILRLVKICVNLHI